MKLKKRLIIAFIIILLIPIILILASGGLILAYQVNSMRQSYDVDSDMMQYMFANPMQVLNRATRGVYNDIKLCALKSPEKFEDLQFVEKLNKSIDYKYSFIALRKDKEFIYAGDEKKLKVISASLPEFGVYNTDVDGGIYVGGKNAYLAKQQDFYYSDGSEGSIFVITDVNTLVPEIKTSAIQFIISFIVIISITAITLTFWIYRSLVRPLNTLRVATNRMKNGCLDFELVVDADDEIGMLCDDFEQMRKRLKELIEEKMQNEKNTKELISNISHDLKTPLTAIKGYAEGIIDGVADTKEKMEKYTRIIYTKANDMSYLVDELSFYSKIDCNTIPYVFTQINVDRYFKDCIEDLGLDLEVKSIDIGYFNYADIETCVIADAEQIKKVINNIIGNSSKYIGNKKGIINVRIKELSEFVQIEIEDNGKGIAEEDLEKIFDRFYRTDASRNSSQGGSGLGLAIAKKIIEDHGGHIWASGKIDVGTTIYFTLRKSIQQCENDDNEYLKSEDSLKKTKKSIGRLTNTRRTNNE